MPTRSILVTTNPRTWGPPRIVRFGSSDFYYYPTGDSMAIYRIEPPGFRARSDTQTGFRAGKLAAKSGWCPPGRDRAPENRYLWEWNDTQGDGEIQDTPRSDPGQAGEVALLALPRIPHKDWQWFAARV